MEDYYKYGKVYGYKCKRGRREEYAKLSKELYFTDARIKYLALDDPHNEYDTAVTERDNILLKLDAISIKIPLEYV